MQNIKGILIICLLHNTLLPIAHCFHVNSYNKVFHSMWSTLWSSFEQFFSDKRRGLLTLKVQFEDTIYHPSFINIRNVSFRKLTQTVQGIALQPCKQNFSRHLQHKSKTTQVSLQSPDLKGSFTSVRARFATHGQWQVSLSSFENHSFTKDNLASLRFELMKAIIPLPPFLLAWKDNFITLLFMKSWGRGTLGFIFQKVYRQREASLLFCSQLFLW